ncbi:MAG: S46 family peptidase [Acidobacteria bacterium]|nr:S46 family peptidase [Acidobacteriota bacterium]
MRTASVTRRVALFGILAAGVACVPAAEGLWLPWQVTADALSAKGCRLEPADFFADGAPGRLCRAVGRTSTGGTGAFVSPGGLVLTNYHVIQSLLPCLEAAGGFSAAQGFLAGSPGEELPLPGLEIELTTGIEDVTDRVRGVFRAGLTPDRLREREQEALGRLVRECRAREGEECRVVPGGEHRTWYRVTVQRLSDVRLVYAPPRSVADLGGEEDNWRMPRFAADFALVRAWGDPRGRPAPHGPANVPWPSADFLPLSPRGVGPGDFQAVIGYPGVTSRARTSADAEFALRRTLPLRVALFREMLEALGQAEASPETRERLAGRARQVANLLDQARGLLEGMQSRDLPARLRARENRQALGEGVDGPVALRRLLDAQSRLLERLAGAAERDLLLGFLVWSCDAFRAADTLNRYHHERDLPDEARSPDFRAGALKALAGRLKSPCWGMSPEADRQLLSLFIRRLARLPEPCRPPAVLRALEEVKPGAGEAAADTLAEVLIDGSRLLDPAERARLMDPGYYRSRQDRDPLLRFHRALRRDIGPMLSRERPYRDELSRLRERALDVGRDGGARSAPDANGTVRVSLGRVRALEAGKAAGTWNTTLAGALARDDGAYPGPLPGRLRDLARQRDLAPWADPATGEVPVNYVCDADLSAGNSGSPVLDGEGRLVGLVFDGLYEAIASDWLHDDAASRAVCVDARYILFLLDRLAGAETLLRELLPAPHGAPAE